jgi:hypothetical protein
MAKSQNIVHQYFKKELSEGKILVKVDPIQFKGAEISISKDGNMEIREMEFDEDIFEDLKADGFGECSSLEFNLYEAGLA